MITHDRGGEWKTIPLTDEQCKDVTLEASSSFDLDEFYQCMNKGVSF